MANYYQTPETGTIAIGDIHGLTVWRDIVDEHPDSKIVFLGDYCDPYTKMEDEHLLCNLLDIIKCHKADPDRIVLLLGNHDMHYIYDDFPRSIRMNEYLSFNLRDIFIDDLDCFRFAFQEGNHLYTHAGITELWWDICFRGDRNGDIAQQINSTPIDSDSPLCFVGSARGGADLTSGPFWTDIQELDAPLRGVHQIVGHNRVKEIRTENFDESTSVTFCDCLTLGL